MLLREKEIVGSILIAQQFTSPVYFHSRPSAVAYSSSGANSGGSNLGPLSKSLNEQVTARIIKYRQENGLADAFPIAADAVSASASGLDPHISPGRRKRSGGTGRQGPGPEHRVQVLKMIRRHLEERQLGIFGEKRVNVLLLNLALDGQK